MKMQVRNLLHMKELEGYRNVVANTKANKEAPHFSGINEEETA